MLKRLKDSLVKSFVGAITLGWIFSQSLIHFAYVFSTPITGWLTRRLYADMIMQQGRAVRGFTLQEATPELIKFITLLLLGYGLLRWLYFEPVVKSADEVQAS